MWADSLSAVVMPGARLDVQITDEGGVAGVREQLLTYLKSAGEEMSISDLLRLCDSDGMHLIDRGEFEHAMRRRFNYTGSDEVLVAIFDDCDHDNSGRIGYDELYRFIRGRPLDLHKRKNHEKLVRNLTLQPRPGMPQPVCPRAYEPRPIPL